MSRTTLPLLMLIGLAIVSVASPDVLHGARLMLADIGFGASVPPNPVNTYMEQLNERERELVLREQALAANRERTALWIALSVVAGLLAVNFVLDWHRNRA